MPLYDYACQRCGPFSATQPMAQFNQPSPCPDCGVPSARTLAMPVVLAER